MVSEFVNPSLNPGEPFKAFSQKGNIWIIVVSEKESDCGVQQEVESG